MDWGNLFTIANTAILLPWAALILAPRNGSVHALIFYLGVGLLALAYTVLFGTLIFSDDGVDWSEFGSLEGVMRLFDSEPGVLLGWIHYLAFDLFVGQWIAKDADHKMVSRLVQAPILLLTLMAGPFGLLVWMIVRERRARAMAGIKSRA
ncbi:ABA4-like family protein [Sphingomicrobium sp. GRR-S6-50]|uniref:ABA4-like family protein n=2 Tax=Sphingomicrobium sediminis TaxID=2950949 RepID=A0A9X2EGS2_9SPHN|nr:ABA4-like family protein [Sphingomicrobium sediminis]MCM8557106.1 ABA4-like family protein [Sphingomicrobium sediminis]